MEKTTGHWPLLWLCCVLCAGCNKATADINYELREGGNVGLSSFAELGIGLAVDKTPLVGFNSDQFDDTDRANTSLQIHLDGRIEWHGLFAETFDSSFSDIALGYRAWQDTRNTVDLLFSSQFSEYEPAEVAGFESLQSRAGDLTLGFRSQHQRGSLFMQLEASSDVSNSHNGVIAAALIGQSWQLRNWNTHALLGARFFSASIVDHYFGVTNSEATATVAAYRAGSGTLASAEFSATLPLNRKWLFNTTLQLNRLPDSVTNSPLAVGRTAYNIAARFLYIL